MANKHTYRGHYSLGTSRLSPTRQQCTPARWLNGKPERSKCWPGRAPGTAPTVVGRSQAGHRHGPATPLLGMCPRETKAYDQHSSSCNGQKLALAQWPSWAHCRVARPHPGRQQQGKRQVVATWHRGVSQGDLPVSHRMPPDRCTCQ